MKKTVFFLIILAIVATGCKKNKKSKSLNYNDSNPIVMALSGLTHDFDYQINVSSDYDISYKAINPDGLEVITVSGGGKIHGKNVGTAQVKIDNSYESRIIDVIVNLFIEPTFDFGCSASRIKSLYGNPPYYGMLGDTIMVYQYTSNHGYSYACGEMDFYFYIDSISNNSSYWESDLYIRPTVEYLLNNYLTENFNYAYTVGDTLDVYKYKQDTAIICGKYDSHNAYNEFCLFYFRSEEENSLDKALNNLPRSSKLRY